MTQGVELSCLLCPLILLRDISFSFTASRQFAAPHNAAISVPGCVHFLTDLLVQRDTLHSFLSVCRSLC